jgi:hypothetical protein
MQDRKVKQEYKVNYEVISSTPEEVERRLNAAFAVLFEHVLRKYKLNKNNDCKK